MNFNTYIIKISVSSSITFLYFIDLLERNVIYNETFFTDFVILLMLKHEIILLVTLLEKRGQKLHSEFQVTKILYVLKCNFFLNFNF